jgi:hypothetical protein
MPRRSARQGVPINKFVMNEMGGTNPKPPPIKKKRTPKNKGQRVERWRWLARLQPTSLCCVSLPTTIKCSCREGGRFHYEERTTGEEPKVKVSATGEGTHTVFSDSDDDNTSSAVEPTVKVSATGKGKHTVFVDDVIVKQEIVFVSERTIKSHHHQKKTLCISLLTSTHMHGKFLRLLFLQAHRKEEG